MENKNKFKYTQEMHMMTWLEYTFPNLDKLPDIPKNVYDSILAELELSGIKNLHDISTNEIKGILKKLHMYSYYEHIPHIICKISGKQPPTLDGIIKETIRNMFHNIQLPFKKYCPKDRINFLSFTYVLHKFFQILQLDEHAAYFPLLKSREKLRIQDKLWKQICDDLGWPFYSSLQSKYSTTHEKMKITNDNNTMTYNIVI